MRVLTEIQVDFISLVKRPATGKSLFLKGEQPVHVFEFTKNNDELMRAYGIVYSPGITDLQGDTADAPTIRKAADAFMQKGISQRVDIEHSFTPTDAAYVAESWLVRKGDPLFPEEPDGAWAVGVQVTDPMLWNQLKKGEITGFSMAGTAKAVQKSDSEMPTWFSEFLKNSINLQEKAMPQIRKEDAAPAESTAALTEADVRRIAREVIEEYMKEKDKPAEEPATEAKSMEATLTRVFNKMMDDKLAPLLKRGVTESGNGMNQHKGGYL